MELKKLGVWAATDGSLRRMRPRSRSAWKPGAMAHCGFRKPWGARHFQRPPGSWPIPAVSSSPAASPTFTPAIRSRLRRRRKVSTSSPAGRFLLGLGVSHIPWWRAYGSINTASPSPPCALSARPWPRLALSVGAACGAAEDRPRRAWAQDAGAFRRMRPTAPIRTTLHRNTLARRVRSWERANCCASSRAAILETNAAAGACNGPSVSRHLYGPAELRQQLAAHGFRRHGFRRGWLGPTGGRGDSLGRRKGDPRNASTSIGRRGRITSASRRSARPHCPTSVCSVCWRRSHETRSSSGLAEMTRMSRVNVCRLSNRQEAWMSLTMLGDLTPRLDQRRGACALIAIKERTRCKTRLAEALAASGTRRTRAIDAHGSAVGRGRRTDGASHHRGQPGARLRTRGNPGARR